MRGYHLALEDSVTSVSFIKGSTEDTGLACSPKAFSVHSCLRRGHERASAERVDLISFYPSLSKEKREGYIDWLSGEGKRLMINITKLC